MCLSSRLQAQAQPIVRSLLRIDLSIVPDFCWAEKFHGTTETFVIIVEDVDGEIILFHDSFVLRQRYAEDEHNMTPTVPMFEPVTQLLHFHHLQSLVSRDVSANLVQASHPSQNIPVPDTLPQPPGTTFVRTSQQGVRGHLFLYDTDA